MYQLPTNTELFCAACDGTGERPRSEELCHVCDGQGVASMPGWLESFGTGEGPLQELADAQGAPRSVALIARAQSALIDVHTDYVGDPSAFDGTRDEFHAVLRMLGYYVATHDTF